MSDDIRPAGSCLHRPISNGWSSSARPDGTGQAPYSWCGRCKAYVEHDAEWAAKFQARAEARSEDLVYLSPAGKAMQPMTAYQVVHYLLRQVRGPASKHWCVECQKPAQQWAYDHADAFARVDTVTGQVFSVNFEHYQPMCAGCHLRLDLPHRKAAS